MTKQGSDSALHASVERLAQAGTLLIAMDFDGTLAPIVERPEDARPLPASYAALVALGKLPRTHIALISGRALASLHQVASPPPEWLLVGSHGVEVDLGNGEASVSFTPDESRAFSQWQEHLVRIANEFPGALIELKPAGLAFHTRNVADPESADEAVSAAFKAFTASSSTPVRWYERRGKAVREFALRDATKAEGLNLIRAAVHPDMTLFAGDDVTDEDALAQLGPSDVGIHIGQTASVASHKLDSPQALALMLENLLARRRSALAL